MGCCVVLEGMLTAHVMLGVWVTCQAQLSRQGADSKQLCLGVAAFAAAFPALLRLHTLILILTSWVVAAGRSGPDYWEPLSLPWAHTDELQGRLCGGAQSEPLYLSVTASRDASDIPYLTLTAGW